MILRGKRDYFSGVLNDYFYFNYFLDAVLTVRKEISSTMTAARNSRQVVPWFRWLIVSVSPRRNAFDPGEFV
jgi:hypothetical protein